MNHSQFKGTGNEASSQSAKVLIHVAIHSLKIGRELEKDGTIVTVLSNASQHFPANYAMLTTGQNKFISCLRITLNNVDVTSQRPLCFRQRLAKRVAT